VYLSLHHLGSYCILFRRFLISKINVALKLTKLWLKKVTTTTTTTTAAATTTYSIQTALLLWTGGTCEPSDLVTTGSLRRRSDHPVIGGDLVDGLVPAGWGRLILMYSQSTSGSSEPGERPATSLSGDVSSTRQHSITSRASEKEEEFKEEGERRKMLCWRGARFCDFSVTVTATKEGDTLIFRAWAKVYLAHPTATQQQARRVTFCWCFLFLPLILSLFFNN